MKSKTKEILLYLIFGGLTTVISISVFYLLNVTLGANEHFANIVSWLELFFSPFSQTEE